MDICVSRMAEMLQADDVSKNPDLQAVVNRYRRKLMFDEIILGWTDLTKVAMYRLEDYEHILQNLPVYAEQLLSSEHNIGVRMLNAPRKRNKKRLL